MLSQTGWNMLNPIGTCGNMAQAGAVLAVAVKARNVKMKQIAYPSALSATLGITEPAIFGVTLRLGKPFIMSMIGGWRCWWFFGFYSWLKSNWYGINGYSWNIIIFE